MLDASLNKTQIRTAYRRIAPIYNLWSWLTESKAHDLCLEWAAIDNGERILEMAVGTGNLFARALTMNPDGHNVGIDLSDAMLRKAQRRADASGCRNFELRLGDAYQIEAQDGSFDLLLCTYMFDLIPERDFPVILAEFRRVLAPDGRMVLVDMTVGDKWYNRVWPWVYRVHPALLGGCRGVELERYVVEAGFEQPRRRSLSQFTFPSEVLAAVVTQRPG